jgi:DNA-binding NarL/FixJ family response regulator
VLPNERIRILLVEDHALFRRGLSRLLTEHGFDVVGEAANGEAGVALAEHLRPDVVLTDLHMPVMGGVEVAKRVSEGASGAKVMVLTISMDDADVIAAIRAGASGYLYKDAEPREIASALRATARGEVAVGPGAAAALVGDIRSHDGDDGAEPSPPLTNELSDREREILALLASGLENAEIAQRLFLSPSTVKNHVSSILAKLGVDSRVQAAVHAVRSGLA